MSFNKDVWLATLKLALCVALSLFQPAVISTSYAASNVVQEGILNQNLIDKKVMIWRDWDSGVELKVYAVDTAAGKIYGYRTDGAQPNNLWAYASDVYSPEQYDQAVIEWRAGWGLVIIGAACATGIVCPDSSSSSSSSASSSKSSNETRFDPPLPPAPAPTPLPQAPRTPPIGGEDGLYGCVNPPCMQ
jgi:hypothetical protein